MRFLAENIALQLTSTWLIQKSDTGFGFPVPETFPVLIFRYIHEVYKILGQKNWFWTIFGLKTLHCKSRPVGKFKNPMPESDFSGRNTFRCQFSHLNIDFMKVYTDLSPISKMGAYHTIQDGGINVGRVYWWEMVHLLSIATIGEAIYIRLFSERNPATIYTKIEDRKLII